jgi:two-component system LytT family response regulator
MESGQDKIQIIIADDEQPIRQLLQFHLSSFPRVNVMATAGNGLELLSLLEHARPTAVFLDVEMPGLDGLSLAARLRLQQPDLFIVFVTAYPQYAANAYQMEAVDYLLKPVTREALERAVGRIERFSALNRSQDGLQAPGDRLAVKNGREIYLINLHDILFMETEARRTVIHTVSEKYSTTEPLCTLHTRLSQDFFRCHRSFIINLKRIEKIVPVAERVYKITFHDYPHSATMGRHKFQELANNWLQTLQQPRQAQAPPPE